MLTRTRDLSHRDRALSGASFRQGGFMPILFMALTALLIFLAMGLMLFYAAYAESHTPEAKAAKHAGPLRR